MSEADRTTTLDNEGMPRSSISVRDPQPSAEEESLGEGLGSRFSFIARMASASLKEMSKGDRQEK